MSEPASTNSRTPVALIGALLACVALAPAALAPAAASAATAARRWVPRITSVRCWPPASCSRNPSVVRIGGRMLVYGRGLGRGMQVVFALRPRQGRQSAVATASLIGSHLAVTVPAWATSGRIYVISRSGRRSNRFGPIHVLPALPKPKAKPKPPAAPLPQGTGTAFDGSAMWIWELDQSSGGDPQAIADQALAHGVNTLIIKAGDGSTAWPQFSSTLIAALKARGLHVCAWQYVYGTHPIYEAQVGAGAVALGADCLVIDAESEYEGLYSQAQTYIEQLRAAIGPSFPVALAGFPYVDYHPAFPYSIFLGPNGAQLDVPQMYWKDIGVSVDTVYAHTFEWNMPYDRPILPLGQLFQDPSSADVTRFRQLALAYGAPGVSWWDYQEVTSAGWSAIAAPLTPIGGSPPSPGLPALGSGAQGDLVVWVQEHLAGAGYAVPFNGTIDAATEAALTSFQQANGIAPSGVTDPSTWQALLQHQPVAPDWTVTARPARALATRARGALAAAARGPRRNGPASAALPAVRDEIPPPQRLPH